MKIAIRIFNVVIMAIAVAAGIFLFTTTAFSFNSKIAVDVGMLSQFVPNTQYTEEIDVPKLLGTDVINLSVKFNVDMNGMNKAMTGDRDAINEMMISNNVEGLTQELHEPVERITSFVIRSTMKSTIRTEITTQVKAAVENAKNKGIEVDSTAEEIMDECEINDEYFTSFSNALYDAADADDATLDSVGDVLYQQIDEALAKSEESGMVDTSSYSESAKAEVKNNLATVFQDLKLVGDGGKLKRISNIAYIYLAAHLKDEIQGKVSDPTALEQRTGEGDRDYADRLIDLYVTTQIPNIVYQILGYVFTALYIGLFVFAGIWGILFLITLIKTFTKKPWTMFGPWFWIIGALQLVLGIGLTILGKFVLPSYNISSLGLPLKSVILAPRTYALVPSLIYAGCIIVAIVYAFFKSELKNEIRRGR